MNLKRIPYYLLLISLTLGASLIIGLLSFGGLYVLWPNLIIASFAFILSVAYEGEIYLQNIKGALSKLFEPQSLRLELSKNFLKNYFPHHYAPEDKPFFFLEYEYELHQLHAFEHQTLTRARREKKREIEHRLDELEQRFASLLQTKNPYFLNQEDRELWSFLDYYKHPPEHEGKPPHSLIEEFETKLAQKERFHHYIRYFSGLTAVFMSIGTTYLLAEAFSILPFLIALPVSGPLIIVPMAIVSGLAYGLLTYNTLTNIVIHDKIHRRIQNLRENYHKNGLTWRNTLMLTSTAVLGALAVLLTFCTAGTWWTIVRHTPPLFRWMKKIPSSILGITIPLVTGIAALAFNIENSNESLEIVDGFLSEKTDWKTDWENFKYRFEKQWNRENILQRINPFRFIIATTLVPLRFILFLGHLISIGVTADRVPGLSKIFSALLGIISELFEDAHYFLKNTRHQHDTPSLVKERLAGEDHNHDDDLPTRMINFISAPLHFLSALWDYSTSQLNKKNEDRLSLDRMFNRHQLTPKIPLEDLSSYKTRPKKSTTTDLSMRNSIASISNYLSSSKQQNEIDDTVLSNCPCCPSPLVPTSLKFYKNQRHTGVSSIGIEVVYTDEKTSTQAQPKRVNAKATPIEKQYPAAPVQGKQPSLKTTSSSKMHKMTPSVHPFFNTTYCTVIPPQSNTFEKTSSSKLRNQPIKAASNPLNESLLNARKPLHPALHVRRTKQDVPLVAPLRND